MMETVSETEQMQSIEAFQSVIRKSENALQNMTEKGANTSVLEKRLHALCVSLHVLGYIWNRIPEQGYSRLEITEARHVMNKLLASVEKMIEKTAAGTPQRTLLERRIRAFQLAVQAMDEVGRIL
ncbi:hypothetical protein [Paenibacillus sp. AN1007]|uniref:Uncharacterized protein n=1 Tax=Paenibacillus sp. AN1007 TaxID=3151385 RepID=A0AAU8NLK9_9BACL